MRHSAGFERHATVETDGSVWPDLDDATAVIFAGASGGGNGVKNNVDRVGAKLASTNPGLTDFRAIIDASFTFETSTLDYTKSVFCAQNPSGCAYESFMRGIWDAVDRSLYAARGDESCRQYHASREPGSEWVCSDKDHVTNDADVYNIRVNGINWSDTVWNWWTGGQPQQSIQAYNGVPGPIAGCP